MKSSILFALVMVAGLVGPAHALERTAALPYDYGNSVNKVFVPNCAANQYVAVSGTIFVCKDFPTIPTCTEKQTLTQNNGVWACKDMPSAVPAGSFCGVFGKYIEKCGYPVSMGCSGMSSASRNTTTCLTSCPSGYSLVAISADSVYHSPTATCSSCGSSGYTSLEGNLYSCIKN
jgi:hypothetical protein